MLQAQKQGAVFNVQLDPLMIELNYGNTLYYTTLTAAIKSYTEVDATIFTQAIIDEFIMAAEHRINIDCPMDSDRFVEEGTMAADVII